MNRYLGFVGHRFGDLFINTAACRILKQFDPRCHLTFVINGDYREAAPLFIAHPYIDKIYVTDSPVGAFNATDIVWINQQNFSHIFDPMVDHNHSDPWFLHRNQPQELAYINGIPTLAEETGKLYLNKWFKETEGLKDYVAFQAFAGSYDAANKKALSPARAQEIVNIILSNGYKVLQLGLPHEPKLEGTTRLITDYFTMARNMLGCKALVTTDSGVSWLASCYDFPTLGLYSHDYYTKEFVKNIQPLNNRAVYLDEVNVNDISLDKIKQSLHTLLL